MGKNRLVQFISAALFAPLFLPIAFIPVTLFPWHFGKTILFQALVEIILVLTVVLIVYFPEWQQRLAQRLAKWNWIDITVVAWLAVLTITALTGVNFDLSFWGNQSRANGVFAWLHFGVWYFLLTLFFTTRQEWRRLAMVAVGIGVLAAGSAWLQNYLPLAWRGNFGSRFSGIIGNSGFLASFLVAALGVVAIAGCASNRQCERRILLAVAAFFFITILLTASRGAAIGLGAGVVAAGIAALFLLPRGRPRTVAAIGIGGLVLIMVSVVFLARVESVRQRFPQLGFFVNFSTQSSTAQTRLMAWQSAWEGIKARPIQGWGWGNFEVIFQQYYNPQFLRFSFQETFWDKPHNFLIETATAAGLFGFLAYLGLYGALLAHALRPAQAPGTADVHREQYLQITLFGALIAYAVQNVFIFETSNSLMAFFFIAAFVATRTATKGFSAADDARLVSPGQRRVAWWQNAGLALLTCGLLVSLWKVHILPFRASGAMARADAGVTLSKVLLNGQQAVGWPTYLRYENAILFTKKFTEFEKEHSELTVADIARFGTIVTSTLEEAITRYPENPTYPLWAGEAYLSLGERVDARYLDDAERVLKRAETLAPRKQEILFLLSRLYLLKRDFPSAAAVQQRAIDVAPEIAVSHWFLALVQVASGQVPQALLTAQKAEELGFGFTTSHKLYLADLYVQQKNYGKVIEIYQGLLEAEPENLNWYIKLATAYAVAGNREKAQEVLRQGIQFYPPLKDLAKDFIKQYHLE